MLNRNAIILLLVGAGVILLMAASLARFTPARFSDNHSDVANRAKSQPGTEATEIKTGTRTAASATRTFRTAPASGALDTSGANTRQLTTHTADADDKMSPDFHEPDPLAQMGLNLRNHPGDIQKLMEQLLTETDPDKIMLLAQLIAENAEAAGVDLPIEDLLKLAGSDLALSRQAALMILATSSKVTPEMIGMISGMAKSDPENDVKLIAIGAMGRWMNQESNLREELSLELINARDASQDPGIRGYAIQTIGLQKNGLPDSMVAPMAESLNSEAVPENRSLAALALSQVSPSSQPIAVETFEQAYNQEQDLDAKRHLITMIMRTAKTEAPEILKRLPASDPLLRQDVTDYVQIIESGVTDIDQIYEQKNARDGDRGTEPDVKVSH